MSLITPMTSFTLKPFLQAPWVLFQPLPVTAGIAIGAGLEVGFEGVGDLGVQIRPPVFLMESCP